MPEQGREKSTKGVEATVGARVPISTSGRKCFSKLSSPGLQRVAKVKRGELNSNGVILLICLIVVAALLLLGSALIVMTQSSYISAGVERDEKRALYTAFAGIERAIYELNQYTDWNDEALPSDLYTDESLIYEAGDNIYAGSYTVKLKGRTQNDVRIESEGKVNNSRRKISARVAK